MWKIVLLVVIFKNGELVQVVEPLPGTRFETVGFCEKTWDKLSAKIPLPAEYVARHYCVSP